MGAQLATLETQEEIMWMKGYRSRTPALRNYAWVGGFVKAGRWLWAGRPDDTPMKFSDWIAGQPDNLRGQQGCVMLTADDISWIPPSEFFKFDDAPCNGPGGVPFICELANK